ncbi:sugar transporter SWEET1 [Hyposmocoma kahamanoa]|uniref:sugar transporter SWEET1 n=1 Tax=Hyposmocoma kahamanoa TaxID=1477025 RepID=UPI000E6D9DE7|nr:sugar transporter SWEET1 [Hyposmocoma kahamanoa]
MKLFNSFTLNLLEAKECIGNLAVITTILQFLSGVLVCKQYMTNKTTGEASVLPFLSCILSSLFWLLYGHVKHDEKIILVNVIGIILMSAYTGVFYVYTLKKTIVVKQCVASCVIFICIISYISGDKDHETFFNHLGILATIFTLLNIAAPMSKLLYVIRVKNTECLPFPIILMTLVVTTLWAIYGALSDDFFLTMVNFTGAVLALVQLSLFLIYPSIPTLPLLPKHI